MNRLLFWHYLIIYDVFVNNICTISASSSDSIPQRRRLSEISSHRGYGTHYVTLSIGSPPQSMRLAISTGSDYTSLPCKGCSSCSNPKFQFLDEKIHNCPADCLYPKSKCQDGDDAENPRCHLSASLSDMNAQIGGGFKGFEVTDSAYIEMPSEHLSQSPEVVKKEPFPLHFLCLEDITGEPSLSDGLLSMSNYPLSFINQFVDNKKIKERLFSMCFRDFDEYEPEDSSAGHVTFGRMDRNLLDSPLVWARNVGSPELQTSYAVHIRKIYFGVGGSPNHLRAASMGTMSIKPIEVSSNDRNMIVTGYFSMSGESDAVMIQTNQPISFLHKSIEESFKSAFFSITGIDYTVPAFPMTERQFKDLPTLFIQLEVSLSPIRLFIVTLNSICFLSSTGSSINSRSSRFNWTYSWNCR
jgi:Xylanase inhibitor N-terminal